MAITDASGGLLRSLTILDLTDGGAGFCSRLLADLGAAVIRIEKPIGSRSSDCFPAVPNGERGLAYQYHHANKHCITLDLEKEEGKSLFLRLLAKTDAVVESFVPGTLEALGLGYDVLSEAYPRLILLSITGFGQAGPRSRNPSCDLVASASGGAMAVCGEPSRPPLAPYGRQPSYVASLYGAVALLLALRRRGARGRGVHIDLSTQECVASTLDHVLVRYFHEQVIAGRLGNVSWNRTAFILPCRDGHLYCTLSPQWDTLVEWMAGEGMAEDLEDQAWKDEGYRVRHLDHVREVMGRWTRTHTVAELYESGQAMRFPWAPVVSPAEVLESPQLKARGFWVEEETPDRLHPLQMPGRPYRFTPPLEEKWRQAPRPGEDNRRVYREELGLDDDDLVRLSNRRVI